MNVLRLLLTAGLMAATANLVADSHEAAGEANAKALIGHAQSAVGQVVRAAQAEPKLDTGKSEAKPFWEAMKGLNESLYKAETGLSLQDQTFFSNVAAARAQVIQADVALTMNGGGSSTVQSSMKTLSELVTRLDDSFSLETARASHGDELSKAEVSKLEQLHAQQEDLMKKLDQVERNAARNNKAMQAGIKKMREESKKIRGAKRTAAGFATGFRSARLMSSWMWGWHWWWGPWGAWCPGWIDINIDIWVDWIDVTPFDWALVDAGVNIDDLDLAELSEADLAEYDGFLADGDFSLNDDDMRAMTSDMELGWDAVDSDAGLDVMQGMESNYDAAPFEPEFEANTFEDHGMSDFGGGFDDFGDGDW
jgi:hypothetical protein